MAATTKGIAFTHAEDTELQIRVCPSCGVTYAVPARLVANRSEKGGSWYCPNGHSLSFIKTEAQELREKLDAEKRNADWWKQRSQDARKAADHQEARANGYKGALTKVKKRVGNGVCPCCNRSFVDLSRHMETKHPAFKEPVT